MVRERRVDLVGCNGDRLRSSLAIERTRDKCGGERPDTGAGIEQPDDPPAGFDHRRHENGDEHGCQELPERGAGRGADLPVSLNSNSLNRRQKCVAAQARRHRP